MHRHTLVNQHVSALIAGTAGPIAPGQGMNVATRAGIRGWTAGCSWLALVGAALLAGCGEEGDPEGGALEIWIASPAEGALLYDATVTVEVVIELGEDIERASFDGTLEVDGEEVAVAERASRQGMELVLPFEWNTRPLAAGEHEIVVRIEDAAGREGEAFTTFVLGEAMTVKTFAAVVDDDGVFGGGLELEVHVYDAGTSTWLGCVADQREAVPQLVRGLDGEVLPLEAFLDQSMMMRLTEDDDASPCPAPASLGNDDAWGQVDDLYFESEAFTGAALDDRLNAGGTVLAWDRGL